jgi:hypothetical protein
MFGYRNTLNMNGRYSMLKMMVDKQEKINNLLNIKVNHVNLSPCNEMSMFLRVLNLQNMCIEHIHNVKKK